MAGKLGKRLVGVLSVLVVVALAAPARAGDILQAATELHAQYVAELGKLAAWCDDNGLTEEAKKTRRIVIPTDPHKLYVPALPEAVGPAKLPADAPPKAIDWDARLTKLRREHAVKLFGMARQAVRAGQAGLAFDLALAASGVDPNYEPTRRLFGYQKFHEQWRTVYEVRKLRAGLVWSDKFGWLPKSFVRRYEDGQRYVDGRWISAEEDAKRHQDIRSAWEIETEHYTIHTNHSIEAGVALGVKLERLSRLWQQLFVRYYASQNDVVAMFEGKGKAAAMPKQRHEVVYFRDRKDYNATLRSTMPNIEITVGVYLEQPRRAYFFANGLNDDRTLYHEATHQLFHESRPVARGIGRKANFWIIEGIAMFMESLRQEDGYYVLGGFDDPRMIAARYRLLHDNFYLPFDDFVDFDIEQFQKDPRIGMLYSQAAGLANFLVFYDGGRYRDALVAYITALYSGRDNRDTLSQLTAASYEDLDKQYREFVKDR